MNALLSVAKPRDTKHTVGMIGQMLSKHLTLEVIMSNIKDVQILLNINFTGIYAFELFIQCKII